VKRLLERVSGAVRRVNRWSLERAPRRALTLLTFAIVVVFASVWAYRFATFDESARVGSDWQVLLDATRSWLAGGPFYPPEQVAYPFDGYRGGVMYPPTALALFVPFVLLPPVLWWAAPLGLAVIGIARLRPAPWVWPFMALGLLYDNSVWLVLSGNPAMWGFAALVWLDLGWPTLFFLVKPSLFPLALLGANRRSWWIGLGVIIITGILLVPMWSDWTAVVRNAQTGRGLLYSVFDLPLLAAALLAQIGRTSPRRVAVRPQLASPRR
jgi:hypothetical protein